MQSVAMTTNHHNRTISVRYNNFYVTWRGCQILLSELNLLESVTRLSVADCTLYIMKYIMKSEGTENYLPYFPHWWRGHR